MTIPLLSVMPGAMGELSCVFLDSLRDRAIWPCWPLAAGIGLAGFVDPGTLYGGRAMTGRAELPFRLTCRK